MLYYAYMEPTTAQPEEKTKLDKLTDEITEVKKLLQVAYDPKRLVMRGLLYGVATGPVGATLLSEYSTQS